MWLPPTLIFRLRIYAEHVLIAGHNGVRTSAWCSYRCETGIASWLGGTSWRHLEHATLPDWWRCCPATLPAPELVRTKIAWLLLHKLCHVGVSTPVIRSTHVGVSTPVIRSTLQDIFLSHPRWYSTHRHKPCHVTWTTYHKSFHTFKFTLFV
jgi:hypothetical protein